MEQPLSIDLLRRLKLNGYTALIPKNERNHKPVFAITNYPIEDLKGKTPDTPLEDQYIAIDNLLLHEDEFELEGIVLLPDEDLSSAL